MLRSLYSTVSQIKNINGDYSSTLFSSRPLIQAPSVSSSSTVQSSSSSSSFVISYLMNSCGLSEDKAISASKKIHFETSSRPDSVLTFLENNGFTKPYISKLINRRPSVLLADPLKTLKPKFEFFNSMGLSDIDLAMVLSNDPTLLKRSLENQIIPSCVLLKKIVHTDRNVIAALKRSSWVFLQDPYKKMVPNVELLRDHGVPETNIMTLLITQPRALLVNAERFREIVEEIKGVGFDPSKAGFVIAIHGFTSMSKSTWESKLDVYRRWGWSEEEIRAAFRKQPYCMMASEKKIMAIMDFLVNQMGYSVSLMAQRPSVFMLSLKNRIIPRCSVIQILLSKGMIKKKLRITTVLTMAEESFLKKYVIKYELEVPEVLQAYQGQLDCLKLPII